ncbi:cyclic-phosphate processing receiver domain-containing protein [Pseudomonas sp. PH1b]|uniref:cyclic-phosphate processing receiver domain-containing protein n=1 Tax=Pseudomonas sp. PH1b TaxID=1397282 RepID=UPI0004681108|nr:cyclic-phosphate processing receiver domain-containing protein [Pseudomonas sp. PH1b]
MKKVKVFLDDVRIAPKGWIHVFWPNEAIELLQIGNVEEISLDHDLGDDARGTGYDVILWIEEAVALEGFVAPKILVHSANISARLKMEQGIQNIIAIGKVRD